MITFKNIFPLIAIMVASNLLFAQAPAITSFTPQSGPLGTQVTITGNNFSAIAASNRVYFGAVQVTVASSTLTSLLVYVPQGVTYEPISVTVAGSTAYSAKPFAATRQSPLALSNISFGPHKDFAVSATPSSIALADYDFNGVADVSVVTNLGGVNNLDFAVFRNTSDCQNLSLAAEQDFSTSFSFPNPVGLATADLDGDGKLDAAVSIPSAKVVSVVQNFSSPGSTNFITIGARPAATLATGDIKIADMDGDGKPDIVVGLFNGSGSGGIAIYRNASTGVGSFTFSAPQVISFAADPKNIALSDVDGDGKPDIIITDGTSTVRIRRNNSVSGTLNNTSFDTEISFATAAAPQDVSAGDIDGDGKTDLIVACAAAISILRNTATSGVINASSFTSKVDFTGITSGSIDLGDLNGDGKVDIAVSNGTNVAVFQNQSTSGSISLATGINFSIGTALVNQVEIADMNGDGNLDIAATQTGNFISVFLFTPPVTPPPTIASFTPSSGLINSSITITGTNFGASIASNLVYVGAVKATITSASATVLVASVPAYATFGPITVENLTTHLSVYSLTNFTPLFDNNKDFGGRIIPSAMGLKNDLSLGVSGVAQSVSLADLDGDGFSDLIVPQLNDSLTIFRNKGNGLLTLAGFEKFRVLTNQGTTTSNHQAVTADIDGDGKLDIVVITRIFDTDGALLFRNLSTPGSLSFAPSFLVSLPFTTINNADLAVGDMDGDGKPDLILSASGKLSVFRNTSAPGSFCFAPKVDILGTGTRGIGLGDIDGDGKLDIVNANGYFNVAGFKLIQNNSTIGTLSFGAPVNIAPVNAGNINSVVLADLDGDGKLDISWVGTVGSGGMVVMKNIAVSGTLDASSFAAAVSYAEDPQILSYAVTPWSYSQVADMNGDGKPDFIGIGNGGQGFSISQNVGQPGVIDATSFQEGVLFQSGGNYSTGPLAVGDLDGDGKPEVIVPYPNVSIYKNMTYPAPRIDLLKNSSAATQIGAVSSQLFTQGDFQFTNNNAPTVRFGAVASTVTSPTNTQVTTSVPLGASPERVAVTLHGLTGFSALPFTTTFATAGTLDATTFSTNVDFALTTSATGGLTVADFDNDGKPDVATGDGGNIKLFQNSLPTAGTAITTSTLTALSTITASIGATAIAVGDFDGDGLIDLQGNSNIYHNNSGTQAQPISFETSVLGLNWAINLNKAKTNVDFNRDGKTDFVSANSGSLSVNENFSRKGSFVASYGGSYYNFSTFNNTVTMYTATGSEQLAQANAGDFDGDGFDDVVFLVKGVNELRSMRNTKRMGRITTAQFNPYQSTATLASPALMVTADFDMDGKLDIAVAYTSLATISVFKNTSTLGTISFVRQDFTSLANTSNIDASDLDGDGKAEIVTIHGTIAPFNFSILKNTSTSAISFAAKVDYPLATQPLGLALADVNLDGKTDILITRAGPFLSVFQNQLASASVISIASQPITATVCNGATATFSTSATGTTNIVYQWQFSTSLTGTYNDITNGGGYLNATTSILSVNTTGNFGAGFYRCKINGDLAATVFTNAVQLTVNATCSPVITTTPIATQVGGIVTLDLVPLIATANNNLDINSIVVTVPPSSGAVASVANGVLTINYKGISFSGVEQLTIKACDTNGNCATQIFAINVTDTTPSDIIVYNAVSPNGANPIFFIQYIDILPDTKHNTVTIFDRWENLVWQGTNYDNSSVVFTGTSDGGSALPSGVYFYKIEFTSGHKSMTGFISLRRQ